MWLENMNKILDLIGRIFTFMKNIALAGGFLFLVVNGAKGYCLDKK